MKPSTLIVGAGAAGLFLGRALAQAQYPVTLLESQDRIGRKLAVTGGGKMNFSHKTIIPLRDYVSQNPRFCISALKRFTPEMMLRLLDADNLAYECRDDACYFLTGNASDCATLWADDIVRNGGEIRLNAAVDAVSVLPSGRCAVTLRGGEVLEADRVVLACGGKAYPQLGGTESGLRLAERLGARVLPLCPALAPLFFDAALQAELGDLSGIALERVRIHVGRSVFEDSLVFRPDGISGLAVFKASLAFQYAAEKSVTVDFLPNLDWKAAFSEARRHNGARPIRSLLCDVLPRRLVNARLNPLACAEKTAANLSKADEAELEAAFGRWTFVPARVGSYELAEVMAGGIDTRDISGRTMALNAVPNVYVIGEMLDVTGQLGGFNLHWAWASAYAAFLSLTAPSV